MLSEKKFKGIIFDFNGVLLWDTYIHEEVYSELAVKLRGTPLSKAEMDNHLHGVPNKKVLEYILDKEISDELAEKLTHEKESTYRNICDQMSPEEYKLSPGAIELLDKLVELEIPHTIATSSEKSNVDFFIKKLNLQKWFDLSKIIYDNGTFPGKPSPDIYIKAAELINLNPSECIVIEDAISGMKAAHSAGIGHIIAIGPRDAHDNLKKIEGVSQVITELSEVDVTKLFH